MVQKYHPQRIEKKWQRFWQQRKIWEAQERASSSKFYILDMFPYPSAEGLHVGHPEGYTASDVVARFMRMKGCNVLHPMGWDAFGLPAENFAIKTGIHPKVSTAKNIRNMKRQIQALGFSYDWSREVNTTDPGYYKWTQWIFLRMFKRGLAYEATVPINWCPKDKTGLANEEVVGGTCERCGTAVVKKDVRQWLLRITKYADRLLTGLDELDWPEPIKLLQRNWIGRSEGAIVSFSVIASAREAISSRKGIKTEIATSSRQAGTPRNDTSGVIEVFTTRADTLFGATYLVLAPEHPLVARSASLVANLPEVEKYVQKAKSKSDLERTSLEKDKTGVELKGLSAINPITGKRIPIWVADYVLVSYGTGAIMAVPAHDERDHEFATKYKLPIVEVIRHPSPPPASHGKARRAGPTPLPAGAREGCYTGEGTMINSNHYNGLFSKEGGKKITDRLEKNGLGRKSVNYKLRDWVFSRQRYWGEPIPVVHCEKCKEQRRPIVWIIHGSPRSDLSQEPDYTGEENRHWIPWLKERLEAQGVSVYAPRLPKAWQPDYRSWKESIEGLDINENTVLVGHSAGATLLVRWLGEKKTKVRKLILVAPAKFPRVGDSRLVDLYDFTINPLVKDLADEIVVITSNDVPRHLKAAAIYTEQLSARRINLQERGHFTMKDMGTREFPELLAEVTLLPAGVIPVPEEKLPVKLPPVKKYEPTGTGESPLAAMEKWVNVKCPRCGHPAKRETNTMPQWAGSCWYYLRYLDPRNGRELVSQEKEKYWLSPRGVDLYVGGAEHAVLHLMYARFWHMFLYDTGAVSTPEPFYTLKNQGIVLGEDNQKMSKSRGNVINPDAVIKEYGADSMRLYEMFMGPFEAVKPWSTQGIRGVYRFLNKVWLLQEKVKEAPVIEEYERMRYRLIKKITEDIQTFNFNTAVSTFMEAMNTMTATSAVPRSLFETFLVLLSPFAPHIAEELWELLGHKESIALERWPRYDKKLIQEATVEFVVQVNGRLRDRIKAPTGSTEDQVRELALTSAKVKKYVTGRPQKVVFVKNRLINFVV